MEKAFTIFGYWKDDKSPINGYTVVEGNEIPQHMKDYGFEDDDIFLFNMSEDDIKWHIENKESSAQDFIIESYQKYQ